MTRDEVMAQQKKFLASFNNQRPEWLMSVGIGAMNNTLIDFDGKYALRINVKESEDVYKRHKHIMETMPELLVYHVDMIGEIRAL